ncbi:MAG: hypothetical protein U0230_24325 [Polyangiales bacterium]
MIRLRSALSIVVLLALAGCHGARPTTPIAPDVAALRRDAEAHPNDASRQRRVALAELYEADGDPARALPALDRALALAPNDPMLHFARSAERVLHGHPSQAVESLLAAVDIGRRQGGAEAQAIAEVAANDLASVLSDVGGRRAIADRLRAVLADPGKLGPAALREIAEIVIDDAYARGDVATVTSTAARVGCVTRMRVAGPFGPRELLGFDQDFPAGAVGPMADSYDLGPTRGTRPTRDVEARGCAVHLGDGPVLGGGTTYAEAFVDVPAEGTYWLRVETPNSFDLSVDGRSAVRVDRRAATGARIVYERIRLTAGRHELSVKVTTRHPNPILLVSLTGDDGLAIGSARAPSTGFGPLAIDVVDSSTAHLRAAVELTRGDLVSSRETLDAVLPNGRGGGPLLSLRASVALADPLRPEDIARDDARAFLRTMAEHDPDAWFPAIELSRLAAAEGRDQEAIRELREAAERWPELVGFPLTLSSLLLGRGWDAEADRWVEEAVRRLPDSCLVIDAQRSAAARRDRIDVLRERVEALLVCDARSTARLDFLVSARRWDEASTELDRLVGLEPAGSDVRWLGTRIRIAEGKGDGETARRLLARYTELRPRADASVVEAVDHLVASGQQEAGMAMLDRAIHLEPITMAHLRLLRATLGGVDPFQGFRVDGSEVLRAYQAASHDYEQPEVYVLDYAVTRVFEDGSSLHLVHQIIKLQSEEAVDSQGEFAPPGDAAMLQLHTIKADGTRLEPDLIEGKETISMPNLEVGDYIEYEYVRALEPSDDLLGAVLGDRFFFQSFETPFDRSEFLLVMPEGMEPQLDPRGNLAEATVERRDGLAIRRWLVTQSHPRAQEPMSSNPREYLPSVNYGVGATWDAFRDAILDGLADRDTRDPAAVRLLLEILGDDLEANDETKARKIYAWVLENIESTDSLLDDAAHMIAARAGSRARVLHYLLDLVGIESDLVIVRGFGNDQTPSELPDEETYASLLLRLGPPQHPVFVATNQRGTPFGYVPAVLRGQDALVLRRGSPRIRIPAEPRIPDRREIAIDVTLQHDGSADVEIVETHTGLGAISWRNDLEEVPAAVLDQRFEDAYASRVVPGSELRSLHIDGREDPEAPLVMRYVVHLAELGHREGADQILPAVFPTLLAPGYAQVASRTTPELVSPADVVTTIHLRVPEGASFPAIPERVALEGPGGARFVFETRLEGGILVLRRTVHVPMQRVPADHYPELARFARQADQAEGRAIRVRMR